MSFLENLLKGTESEVGKAKKKKNAIKTWGFTESEHKSIKSELSLRLFNY